MRIEIIDDKILAREINHRTRLAGSSHHKQGRHSRGTRHGGVVGTECRGDVHHARTVVSGDIVAGDNAEGLVGGIGNRAVVILDDGLHPGEELAIAHPQQFIAGKSRDYLPRQHLTPLLLERLGDEWQLGALGLKIGVHTRLGHDIGGGLAGVGVITLDGHVVDFRPHAERGVAGQRPRRGGPGEHFNALKALVGSGENALHDGVTVGDDIKLSGRRLVLHVAVAARQVQLMRTEACAGGRRVRLDGISFIQQALVVELLEQPPQGLDITVFISDIGVVEVHPVSHAPREVGPLAGVAHHRAAARGVVVLHTDSAANVLFGDTQFFLHAQFHGQAVSVPTGLAAHLIAQHRLIAADDVLDCAAHHMVDTRLAVGAGRALIKHK